MLRAFVHHVPTKSGGSTAPEREGAAAAEEADCAVVRVRRGRAVARL